MKPKYYSTPNRYVFANINEFNKSAIGLLLFNMIFKEVPY